MRGLRTYERLHVAFNVFAIAVGVSARSPLVFINLGLVAFTVFAVPRLHRDAHAWLRACADLYFLPACMFYYEQTYALHQALYGTRLLDPLIANAELALFGAQPSLRFAAVIQNPFFSEWMSIAYLSFYVLVIGIAVASWNSHHRSEAHASVVEAMNAMFITCYFIYVLVPTAGPRYYWSELYQWPKGFACSVLLEHMLDFGEHPTGAFPSSHVAWATLAMCWTWCYARRAFPAMVVMSLSVAAATVYLQAHYVVDAIAGAALGIAVWLVSERLRRADAILSQASEARAQFAPFRR